MEQITESDKKLLEEIFGTPEECLSRYMEENKRLEDWTDTLEAENRRMRNALKRLFDFTRTIRNCQTISDVASMVLSGMGPMEEVEKVLNEIPGEWCFADDTGRQGCVISQTTLPLSCLQMTGRNSEIVRANCL